MSVGPYELTASELTALLGSDRAGLPYLVLRGADGKLELRTLEEQSVVIGRSPEANLSLSWDAEVSRVHALLERIAGQWMIQDDGISRNGTWIAGSRISGLRTLAHGDVIQIGKTSLVYRSPAEDSDETATPSEGADAASISPAERRVLVELCRPLVGDSASGVPCSNNEIAVKLNLSVPGVKTQVRALFARLEVDDLPQNRKRAELARRAIASGIVSIKDLKAQE